MWICDGDTDTEGEEDEDESAANAAKNPVAPAVTAGTGGKERRKPFFRRVSQTIL